MKSLAVLFNGVVLTLATSAMAEKEPVFDEFVKPVSNVITSTQPISLKSLTFDRAVILNNFLPDRSGTNILLSDYSRRIGLVKRGETDLFIDYTYHELGLNNVDTLRTAFVSKDDESLYVIYDRYNNSNGLTDSFARRYQIGADLSLTPATEQPFQFDSTMSFGQIYTNNSNTGILNHSYHNNVIQYVAVDLDTYEVTHSGALTNIYNINNVFFSSDENKIVVAHSSNQADCLRSFELTVTGEISLIDTHSCNFDDNNYYLERVSYDLVSDRVATFGRDNLSIHQLMESGQFKTQTNTEFSAPNGWDFSLFTFADNQLVTFGRYDGMDIYLVDATGEIAFEKTLTLQDLDISGNAWGATIKDIGISNYVLTIDSDTGTSLTFFEIGSDTLDIQSRESIDTTHPIFSGLNSPQILPISESRFIEYSQSQFMLVNTENKRNFQIVDSISSPSLSSYTSVVELDSDLYLFVSNYQWHMLRYSEETDSITVVGESQWLDGNGKNLYIERLTNGYAFMMDTNTLLVKTSSDRVSLFDVDTESGSMTFKEHYVDFVSGFGGVNNSNTLIKGEQKFGLLNHNESKVASYSFDGEKLIYHGQISNSTFRDGAFVFGDDKFYTLNSGYVNAYRFNDDGDIEYLSTSALAVNRSYHNNAIAIDDNHIILTSNEDLSVYYVDSITGQWRLAGNVDVQTIGLPTSLSSLRLQLKDNLLWYRTEHYQSTVGNITFNRAPFINDERDFTLTFNEGLNQTFDLNEWIIDLELDEVTFTSSDLLPGTELAGSGELTFEGELYNADAFSINALDATGLASDVNFEVIMNTAPTLKSTEVLLSTNQFAPVVLDLVPLFEDAENDVINVSSELAGSLTVSDYGVLNGQFSEFGELLVPVTVQDMRGAKRSVEFTVIINGAPQASGSLNFNETASQAIDINLLTQITDPEGDAIRINSFSLPSGLRLLDNKLVGSIQEVGSFTFLVTSFDAKGAENTHQITLKVSAAPKSGGAMFWMIALLGLVAFRRK